MDETTSGRAKWVMTALGRYESALVAYSARLAGDVHTGRDVVQEAFLRLCSEDESRVGPHVKAWLYTVCRRLVIDGSRKERRMDPAGDGALATRTGRESDPAATAETRDEASHVLRLMAGLPPNQREVIDLKFRHGLMYREIAKVTGLSAGNVGFLIHTGLKTLRERMGRDSLRSAGGAL
jgi:RNA polymerase sigma factor (sigma-70 family)